MMPTASHKAVTTKAKAKATVIAKVAVHTASAIHGRAMRPKEETEVHTRILRLALGIEDSRAYWRALDPSVPPGPRAIQAFEERWFGTKSLRRVRTLLAYFRARYDAFPEALEALRRWRDMDPATRQVICHWHLQLSDPISRGFTDEFLVERRKSPNPELDRDAVMRWMTPTYPGRWASATFIQFASKLLSSASEAGLVTPTRGRRMPLVRKVPDEALEYLLYLLRGVSFSGTLADNPYLASVGLDGVVLAQRLATLPTVKHKRLADLNDFEWKHPSLKAWAEATL